MYIFINFYNAIYTAMNTTRHTQKLKKELSRIQSANPLWLIAVETIYTANNNYKNKREYIFLKYFTLACESLETYYKFSYYYYY